MILPDVLEVALTIVFCGTAVGKESAKRRCYYAGFGNQFWPTLRKLGFVPQDFQPKDFHKLPQYGLGLTDLVKLVSGDDMKLRSKNFDVVSFKKKILRFSPKIIAFNGKRAAEVFFGKSVKYGLQEEKLAKTKVFVLPSTSGAARGYWDETYWAQLVKFVKTV